MPEEGAPEPAERKKRGKSPFRYVLELGVPRPLHRPRVSSPVCLHCPPSPLLRLDCVFLLLIMIYDISVRNHGIPAVNLVLS